MGAISPNFQGLWASGGPVYLSDGSYVGDQISTVAGGKVTKNAISACGWVALSGSVIFCTVGIFNFFAGYFSRDIVQHHAYICET